MTEASMQLLPLHKYTNFSNSCAEILNRQWPRSMGARLHSFRKSCDTLPVALAFVNNEDVIGFSKLSTVQGKQDSCLLESVVIREVDRGKGLGRILMSLTERYAKGIGIETIYLSTIDKEGLYGHLGYTRCKPVLSLGENAHRVPESLLSYFMAEPSSEICINKHKTDFGRPDERVKKEQAFSELSSPYKASKSTASTCTAIAGSAAGIPSAPPPPSPPPLPSSSLPATNSNLSNPTVLRLDPKNVVWMKKAI